MDVSQLKDLVKRLSFLKNYSSLLLPAVLVLAAGFLFIPTQLISGKLSDEISKGSVPMGKSLQSLDRNPVARDQWTVEQKYQQAYENDANQIALLARRTTERQLLSYKIFPEPKDTSMLIFKEFGRQYRRAIDELIVRVNACHCPSDVEMNKALMRSPSSTQYSSTSKSFRRLSELDATIVDILCQEKAKAGSCYVNPVDLSGYEFWEKYEYAGMTEAVEQCWYHQLVYWIIEDVIDTVAAMNSASNSVLTSPVKRLLSVNFSTTQRGAGLGGKAAADTPRYVLGPEEGMTTSCTGRFSDKDVDVVHFGLDIVLSARAVLPFMQELCSAKQHKFSGFFGNEQQRIFKHNQITVLESDISAIFRDDEIHELYRYGEDAVVELNLICEYIFDKKGCDEIMPKTVKESMKKKK